MLRELKEVLETRRKRRELIENEKAARDHSVIHMITTNRLA